MGTIKDFLVGFIGAIIAILACTGLVGIAIGVTYLVAFAVTKMAMLGATNFEGEFRTFFIYWFAVSTVLLFTLNIKGNK